MIRIENNLPDNFGELKMDLEKLIDELYFDCDNVNTALNASNIFYTLIKEKPFVSYNYEIALIIAIKTLSDTNSVKYRLEDENCFVGKIILMFLAAILFMLYNILKIILINQN